MRKMKRLHYIFKEALLSFDKQNDLFIRLSTFIQNEYSIDGFGLLVQNENDLIYFYNGMFEQDIVPYLQRVRAKKSTKTIDEVKNFLFSLDSKENWTIMDTHHLSITATLFYIAETDHEKTIDENERKLFNQTLQNYTQTFAEIVAKENIYFSDSSFFHQSKKSHDTITLLLTLTKLVSNADVVYWGDVYGDLVSVNMHIGAMTEDFGFDIPIGKGAGGKIALNPAVFHMENYLQSEYRYPGASAVLDKEKIKSGLVFPVRRKKNEKPIGLLYVTKRTVEPFSLAERILIERLINTFTKSLREEAANIRHFYVSSFDFIQDKKNELNEMLLSCNRIQQFHRWLTSFLKGKVIIADMYDEPYHDIERASELESNVQKADVKIELHNDLGYLYIFTNMTINDKAWPTFYQDLANVCSIVLERELRKDQSLLNRRKRWLEQLLQHERELNREEINEGVNLGFPLTHGEIWVIAFSDESPTQKRQIPRKLNELAIEQLQSPLTMLDDELGIMLLEQQNDNDPVDFRERLLKQRIVKQFWIIHGALYNNTHQLVNRLIQSIELVKKLRKTNSEQYINEIDSIGFGLHSLLNHPDLQHHLLEFSNKQLRKLIDYDKKHRTNFLNTFIRFNILHSAQLVAKEQFLHVNTVYYRINKSEEILNINLDDPEIETAIKLASFIYFHFCIKQEEQS